MPVHFKFPSISKKQFDIYLILWVVFYSILFSLFFYDGKRIEGHLIRLTGTLSFLMLSAAISLGPLSYLRPWLKPALLYRRHLGVGTAIAALTHGLFAWLLIADLEFLPLVNSYFSFSVEGFPFEILGFTALIFISLMALTSNRFSTSRLGYYWKSVHLLVYPAYFLVVMHISLGAVFDEGGSVLFVVLYLVTGLVLIITGFSLWKTSIKNEVPVFNNRQPLKKESNYLSRFITHEPPAKIKTEPVAVAKGSVRIEFIGDKTVTADAGLSILENSLKSGIEHVFECGGNARCSTCRVLVLEGLENCLPRNDAEQALASRKSFNDEVRLACQTHVTGDVKIKRLVFDEEDIKEAVGQSVDSPPGKEQNLAVLFSDIRSFTPFTEKNLPYDVVHMLNKYFNAIGEPIDRNNGYIDKYMGDGIMVLFGLDNTSKTDPCIEAINAADGMLQSLREVNKYMKEHFNHEFKIGIGIHYGPVIVGEMGFKLKKEFTALGDTVNLASRIEAKTKDTESQLLVSEEVYKRAGEFYHTGRKFRAPIKGKTGDYILYEILF